jgi:hypothetical protein
LPSQALEKVLHIHDRGCTSRLNGQLLPHYVANLEQESLETKTNSGKSRGRQTPFPFRF